MAVEDAAKRLFDNLLNIEVNTLIKPGMTGRKMPAVGQALLDIFGEYDVWLCERIGGINTLWASFRGTPAAKAYKDGLQTVDQLATSKVVQADGLLIRGLRIVPQLDASNNDITAEQFHVLREQAATALEMHRALSSNGFTQVGVEPHVVKLDAGHATMLRRIMRNCDQLIAILERPELQPAEGSMTLSRKATSGILTGASDTEFSGDELMTIRKAWELGTEVIVMQTVVQLDGDIVTRLNEVHRSAEHQPLRDVHHRGVDTAISQWNSLVQTFVTIVDKLTKYLVP